MSNAAISCYRPVLPRRACALLRVLCVAAVVLGAGSGTALAQVKIAVVDVRHAVLYTEDGLRVQARLKAMYDSRQQELIDKEKAVVTAQDALDKDVKAGKLGKPELQKKYEALQQQAMELKKMMGEYQQEMQTQEKALTDPIVQRVTAIIRREATRTPMIWSWTGWRCRTIAPTSTSPIA